MPGCAAGADGLRCRSCRWRPPGDCYLTARGDASGGTNCVVCRVVPGFDGRADVRCTPGSLNPDVSQDTIRATICAPGWTDTVQPPASYTSALKLQQMRDFGEIGSPLNYKEDHLVPLSLGGAPRDSSNLFPQPAAKTAEKEELEDQLHQAVCSGRMTLTATQAKIRHDWTH
jgi:hypothetical protein